MKKIFHGIAVMALMITVTDKDREMGNNFFNFFGISPILGVSNNKVYLETTRYGCFDMCIIPVRRNLAR